MTREPEPLRQAFHLTYGQAPTVTVRAPGRVNLIGEHTDYSLLPVLPLAIDRATRVAAGPRTDGQIRCQSAQFTAEACVLPGELPQATAVRTPWHRYLIGALHLLPEARPWPGAQLYVAGDLPTTGGLSSSSALTMGLLAALNELWQLGLPTPELVARAIRAERQVGVESGGMDQTVIGLAEAGSCLRIDFSAPAPAGRIALRRPRHRAVPLPEDLRLIAAFSGEEAPKGGAVRQAYNARVVGCRLAAAILSHHFRLESSPAPVEALEPPVLATIRHLDLTPERLAQALATLPEQAAAAEVGRALASPVEPLIRLTTGRFDEHTPVLVRAVARHVLQEAHRVDRMEAALRVGALPEVGWLLDESHRSLTMEFQCSTPRLDRLCQAMRTAGALGARLTGAGFGGFALAATTEPQVRSVLAAATAATGGPAFVVRASAGLEVVR